MKKSFVRYSYIGVNSIWKYLFDYFLVDAINEECVKVRITYDEKKQIITIKRIK